MEGPERRRESAHVLRSAPVAKIEVLGDDRNALEDSAHASDDDELNAGLRQGLEDLLDEVLHPSEPSSRRAARTRACEAVRSASAAASFRCIRSGEWLRGERGTCEFVAHDEHDESAGTVQTHRASR